MLHRITGKWDSWVNGAPVKLVLNDAVNVSASKSGTIETITQELGQYFSLEQTVICAQQSVYNALVNRGFSNIMLLTNTPRSLYLTQLIRIEFNALAPNYNPTAKIYFGGVYYADFTYGTNCISFMPWFAENNFNYRNSFIYTVNINSPQYDFIAFNPMPLLTEVRFTAIRNELIAHSEETDTDPYGEHGESTTGGGGGSWSRLSEAVDVPSLPTLSVADTGFISLFAPTFSQLRSLANYMWGDLWDINTFKKIFADPMDAILGLNIVPVSVPSGGASAVVVGNISTGVSMNKASTQFVEVDCGSLNVSEYYGSYLDYAPYTKVQIMLPYIGAVNIDTDDIMKKTVSVKYHVDILTGSCIAFIKCDNSVLYQFNGNCAINIPITGENFTRAIQSVVSLAGNIAGGVVSPPSGGLSASKGFDLAVSSVNNIMGMKPEIRKSGNLGASVGMMGIQKPYLIFTQPSLCSPKFQNQFTGYPSYINRKLSDCKGFTIVNEIHLDGVTATESELKELENILKVG